jgi:hypothetical protein
MPQPKGGKESGAENEGTEQYHAACVNFDVDPIRDVPPLRYATSSNSCGRKAVRKGSRLIPSFSNAHAFSPLEYFTCGLSTNTRLHTHN